LRLASSPRLAIVTAYGREDLIREAEALGIEQVLIKPVSASILFDTAMYLLGSNRQEVPAHEDTAPQTEKHQALLGGADILLVEDNEMNREVAVEILQTAGGKVYLAVDGSEAVRMVNEKDYDIVLMDMQMPVMDGLAATRAIRLVPRFANLPIIAMTASAMKEDRDRCLAAGMNDYITKPIDPDLMFQTLRKYFSSDPEWKPPAAAPTPAPGALPTIAGVDTAGGLRRVVGNKNLYLDLLRRYSEGQRDATSRIRAALDGDDYSLAERLAHTLKGVSGNIGVSDAQAVASELEAAINQRLPGETLDEILARTSAIMASAVARIDSALLESANANNAGKSERIKPEESGLSLQEICSALERFAEENDSEALEYLDSVRYELPGLCGNEYFDRLETAIRAYDFSSALNVLKLIRSTQDNPG